MAGEGTEYGGRPGMIQREADGHVELSVGEAAQLMRAAGKKEAAGDRRQLGTGLEATFVGWTEADIRAEYDAQGDRFDV